MTSSVEEREDDDDLREQPSPYRVQCEKFEEKLDKLKMALKALNNSSREPATDDAKPVTINAKSTEHSWDRGAKYEELRKSLLTLIKGQEVRPQLKAYAMILLIQLVNGLSVKEACEAAFKWANEGRAEVEVRALRHKRDYHRLVVIPRDLSDEEREVLKDVIKNLNIERLVKRVETFCKRKLGYNTHSLKYAYINRLAQEGLPPRLIAKLIGCKKPNYILSRYYSWSQLTPFRSPDEFIVELMRLYMLLT